MLNLLIIILLFSFFLSDVVSVGPNLYPLRIVAPIILIYGTILLFHKSIVKKVTFKIPEATWLTLCFFIFMAFSTFGISGFRNVFLSQTYELNDLLNYLFVFVLVFGLIVIGIQDKKSFFKKANGVILVVYFLYLLMAIYEIRTGFHFPNSTLYDASDWMKYSPTVVYFNSNDFAAIFTMMLMYLLFNQKKEAQKGFFSSVFLLVIIILHTYILYESESRLSLLVFAIFLIYSYTRQFVLFCLFSLVALAFIFCFVENSWFMQGLDEFAKFQQDFSFEERNSTLVRLYLYKHALLSVFDSYGLGFGVFASEKYYQSIADPNLFYITNPHSYIFEILINSGFLSFIFYILLNTYMMAKSLIYRNKSIFLQLIFYNLLLFSSSSSLFLWPIYLFFILYVFQFDAMIEDGRTLTNKLI